MIYIYIIYKANYTHGAAKTWVWLEASIKNCSRVTRWHPSDSWNIHILLQYFAIKLRSYPTWRSCQLFPWLCVSNHKMRICRIKINQFSIHFRKTDNIIITESTVAIQKKDLTFFFVKSIIIVNSGNGLSICVMTLYELTIAPFITLVLRRIYMAGYVLNPL